MPDNKWVVKMGDGKEYLLEGSQMKKFREAIRANARLVDFGDFGINLAFVERFWEVKEPKHPELSKVHISEEQRGRNLKRIAEMKKKLAGKFSMPEEVKEGLKDG